MSPRNLAYGIAVGIALGVAYTASPLTVWFVITMAGVFVWTGRGLGARERTYVWGILTAAIAIRALALAVLFLSQNRYFPDSFFWDGDGVHLKHRSAVIQKVWMAVPVSSWDLYAAFDPSYGWSTYLYVIAYLQYLTGPAPYGVHLFNVTIYIGAGVLLHRLARTAYGRAPALLGLTLMLLMPTLIAWSVSALKESLYVFLCAVGLMAAVTAVRPAPASRRLVGVAVLAGAIAANSGVRTGASLIMVAGYASGWVASIIVRRATLSLLILLLLPVGVLSVANSRRVQDRILAELKVSAVQHVGHVITVGNSYRLLDQRLYWPGAITTMTPGEGLRYAVRAAAGFILVPLPWQVESRAELVFLGQQVIWYLLVLLAFVGLVTGLRRDTLVTCLLAGLATAGAAVIALNSGNIGTMVRFRDTTVPFVVWLAALGATSIASRIQAAARPQEISAE